MFMELHSVWYLENVQIDEEQDEVLERGHGQKVWSLFKSRLSEASSEVLTLSLGDAIPE